MALALCACPRGRAGRTRRTQPTREATRTVSYGDRTRNSVPSHSRVVLKVGTSLLTGGTDRLDLEIMSTVVGQVARARELGYDVLLVSSGAVAAGRHVLKLKPDSKVLTLRQALAAVGQGHLMNAYEQLFSWHEIHVAQALLSRRDLVDRLGYLNVRNTLLALLERRVVPVINENDVVAVEELEGDVFGDNDTLSAMVANLVDADLLVLLGELAGLYTADPHLDPDARLIPYVERADSHLDAIAGDSWDGRGRGGMATKLYAARLATASGISVAMASGKEPNVLLRLLEGEDLGTYFPATSSKMESRKRWMLSGLSTRGEIVVDDGAASVLRERQRSLLPAGVKRVNGPFNRGDIISIMDASSVQIACGITNYDSHEVSKIMGIHSGRIVETLGHQYGEEVVHRNNMVVL